MRAENDNPRRRRRVLHFSGLALASALALSAPIVAEASEVNIAEVDTSAPTNTASVYSGQTITTTINWTVTGAQAGTATFSFYTTWTLSGGVFTGSVPTTVTVGPRSGGDPATTGSVSGVIVVSTSQAPGPFELRVPTFDITNTNSTGGKLADAISNSLYTVVVLPPSDTTPPTITPLVTGTLGNNGWYTSDVIVSWTIVDNESTPSPSTCAPTTINTDTAGQTVTCSSTSAGGTTSQSVTIKRDATKPSINASVSSSPSLSGWYNISTGAPTVSFSCSDAMSGVASCSGPTTLGSGADQSVTGTVEDNAGNTNTATVSDIDVDLTTPSISGSVSPAAASTGWYNESTGAPTVSFTCSDTPSGLKSCTADTPLGEGADQSVTGTAEDNAGNTNTATVSNIDVDLTDPTVNCPSAGSGWFATNQTLTCTVSDSLSGFTGTNPELSTSVPAGTETDNASTGTASVCDVAGNCATAGPITGWKIDRKAPTGITFTGTITNGAVYYFGSVPPNNSGCDATDGGSGFASCTVGGYSTAVGTHTLTAPAKDNVGNESTATLSYEVKAWTLKGFYQPVDMGGVWNTVKNGSTVPLKFEVFAGLTELTDTAVVDSFTVRGVACPSASTPVDDIELTTTGGTALRYDATAGQFVQNWQTPKKPGSCYSVTMLADDGSSLTAYFKLK